MEASWASDRQHDKRRRRPLRETFFEITLQEVRTIVN